MNPRNTLALAVVVAALGAFVWFYEIRGAVARDEAAAAEKRLFPGVEADLVTAIELTTTDGADARLERDSGVWTLTRPVDFPADAAAADGLAGSLASLMSESAFDEPAPLAEYGLDGEPLVRFEAGEREGALRVGKTSPVGSNTYVATAADAPVYVVETYRTTALRKSLDDLREKRILDFDERQLRRLALRWPDGGVVLTRESEETPWRVIEPVADAADDSTVDRLVSDLRYLRAIGFDDAPGDDEALGLATPAFDADLELAASDEESRRIGIAIGDATSDDKRAVRAEREGMVFEIAAAGLDDFPRRVDAYRDRELLRFAAGDAARIEFTFADGGDGHVVTAERGDEGWSSQPESVEGERLTRLVTELAGLRAESIAAESAGPEELVGLGLDPAQVQIRVFKAEGTDAEDAAPVLLGELAIGSTTAGRGFVARRPDRATVFLVDAALAEHIPVSLDALRNRFLAPPPTPPDAAPSPSDASEPGSELD
ncbi:MAG: DUF4340 domain-containing protein [Myxococcales bacterium]|nr:DUF4340 domain-containing protein [Myxococcales bacterium]